MKLLALTCLHLLLSINIAASNSGQNSITYAIPEQINVTAREIDLALHEEGLTLAQNLTLKISVFYYSENIERYSLSDTHKLSTTCNDGLIQALVKVKKKGELIKTLFVKGKGKTKAAILKNFALNLKKQLD